MVEVVISGEITHAGYSSALSNSCVSLAFWTAHQVLSTDAHPTVSYCVTVPTTGLHFTTPIEFYVCDNLEFDVILGQDFNKCCHDSLGEI
jgi:hypothetical protein